MTRIRPRRWIAASCFGVAAWMLGEMAMSQLERLQSGEVLWHWGWLLGIFVVAIPGIYGWAGWRLMKSPVGDHFKLAVFLLVVWGYFVGITGLRMAGWIGENQVWDHGLNLVGLVLGNHVWAWVCAWGMRSEGIEVGRFEFVRRSFLFFVAAFLALFLCEVGEWLDAEWEGPPWQLAAAPLESELLWGMARGFGPLLVAVIFYQGAKCWLVKHGACWGQNPPP